MAGVLCVTRTAVDHGVGETRADELDGIDLERLPVLAQRLESVGLQNRVSSFAVVAGFGVIVPPDLVHSDQVAVEAGRDELSRC